MSGRYEYVCGLQLVISVRELINFGFIDHFTLIYKGIFFACMTYEPCFNTMNLFQISQLIINSSNGISMCIKYQINAICGIPY